jgi:hypothetical protein
LNTRHKLSVLLTVVQSKPGQSSIVMASRKITFKAIRRKRRT